MYRLAYTQQNLPLKALEAYRVAATADPDNLTYKTNIENLEAKIRGVPEEVYLPHIFIYFIHDI